MLNKNTNTPHISRRRVFLDTKEMLANPIDIFEKYRKELGPTFSFHFGGTRETIVTADPDFLKYILKDNNSNYNKSHIQVERFVEFQGVGLTNSHGDYWLRQRKLLSMGFTRGRLTEIMPIQLRVLKDFMAKFDEKAEKVTVDIHSEMTMFTLRSVGKSLFGSEMQETELEQFAEAIAKIQAYVVKKVVQPYLTPWFLISGENKKHHQMRAEADQIVKDYVEKRRKEGSEESDILQLILDTPYKDTGEFMDDERIMIEILQLLVAGNETSTNAASWAFYVLAQHPEEVEKIRAEINEVFGDEEVSYGGLMKLTYTNCVLDEAMRMYPPFWMIDREALEDDEYNGIKIPKGTTVVPYIYGAHQNEAVWPEPERFDPSRFEGDRGKEQHKFAHIPFGGGPRVCVGQNMAKMQILLVMAAIIKKYNFSLTADRQVNMKAMMILRPDGPINLDFTLADSVKESAPEKSMAHD